MDKQETEAEVLFAMIEDYTFTSVELFKLRAVEKATIIAVSAVSKSSVVIAALLFIIFSTVGAALLLGELLGSSYSGFFVVGGLYVIMAILFHFRLKIWLRKPLGNQIIKNIFQNE
jgi:hypothetical protein